MVIEIGKDYSKTPPIKCPYCNKELHMLVDAFKPDITKIVKSNCPHCGGKIFASLMIVTAVQLQQLVSIIADISSLFVDKNVNFVDGDGKSLH